MVNGVNYTGNYQIPNINKEQVQQTISKSTEAVSNKVEENAIVDSALTIDRTSVLLSIPLVALIKFINNHLMSGDNSLVQKFANFGDFVSDKLNLPKLGNRIANGKNNFAIKHPNATENLKRFKKYFTDDFKAIPKSSFARTQKMSEKYADALKEVLISNNIDVADDISFNKLIDLADDFIKGNSTSAKQAGLAGMVQSRNIRQISGLRNMLQAADSQMGKSGLGKFLSKAGLKAKEIAFSTSDFLGKSKMTLMMDLFSIMLFANVLKRATQESKQAPKGEKFATFMHVLSEDYAPLMIMQPATSLLYKVGGNKYRGMNLDSRKKVADIVSSVNSKKVVKTLDGVAEEAIDKVITKDALKVAKLQKKMLMKGASVADIDSLVGKTYKQAKALSKGFEKKLDLKFWEKPLKWLGSVLDIGLDTIKSPSKLGKVGNKMKGFAGGLGRFILILFVLSPLLQKPITKLCHMLFGKPKAYLDKQKAAEEAAKKAEEAANNPQPEVAQTDNDETNLVKIYTNKNTNSNSNSNQTTDVNNQITSPVASTEIVPEQSQDELAALNLFNKDKNTERYIPSSEVDFSYEQQREKEIDAQVEQILKRSDYLLKRAKKDNL